MDLNGSASPNKPSLPSSLFADSSMQKVAEPFTSSLHGLEELKIHRRLKLSTSSFQVVNPP